MKKLSLRSRNFSLDVYAHNEELANSEIRRLVSVTCGGLTESELWNAEEFYFCDVSDNEKERIEVIGTDKINAGESSEEEVEFVLEEIQIGKYGRRHKLKPPESTYYEADAEKGRALLAEWLCASSNFNMENWALRVRNFVENEGEQDDT